MRVAIVLALVAACRIQAAFECDFDEQCRDGDVLGTCQLEKFCSFPDDSCASGQRFADNAGGALAGTCIDEAPIPDDSGIDAAPFDISLCPQSYNRELGQVATSKYRLITSRANVWAQAAACKADLPGATHLVVIDNAEEMNALRANLPVFPPLSAYVGVVQDPAATTASAGWIHFDGRAVSGLWTGPEPDNQQMPEVDFHANVAILSNGFGTGLEDTQGTQTLEAFCECDGTPVHSMAQAFLDGDPSKP
jgi:hypothetical protein